MRTIFVSLALVAGFASAASAGNTVRIQQQGGGVNNAVMFQTGSNNLSSSAQFGRRNNASVEQQGTGRNYATGGQAGLFNGYGVSQIGRSNTATIQQLP